MANVKIKKSTTSGCVISPPVVKLRKVDVGKGFTIQFTTVNTKATVLIPNEDLVTNQVLNISSLNGRGTIQIKKTADLGVYEYAVYGFDCNDVRGRGKFGKGNSPPKIIIG